MPYYGERQKGTISLIFGCRGLRFRNLVYNLLAVLTPILRFVREGTHRHGLWGPAELRKQAMSKLFETIRRLEKDPDSVAVESPVGAGSNFPVATATLERSIERSVPLENGNSLLLRWPVEPPVEEAPPVERTGSRIMAVSLDAGMILIALGLFVGVFFLA